MLTPKLDPDSEIARRETELRALAGKCDTVLDLARHLKWPIQSATRANDALELGLPELRNNRTGKPREAQPQPKPVGKGKKGAGE